MLAKQAGPSNTRIRQTNAGSATWVTFLGAFRISDLLKPAHMQLCRGIDFASIWTDSKNPHVARRSG